MYAAIDILRGQNRVYRYETVCSHAYRRFGPVRRDSSTGCSPEVQFTFVPGFPEFEINRNSLYLVGLTAKLEFLDLFLDKLLQYSPGRANAPLEISVGRSFLVVLVVVEDLARVTNMSQVQKSVLRKTGQ